MRRKKKISILIIDDDRECGASLKEFLTSEGFLADHLTDPHKALDRLKEKPYQIVLLDLRMTGLNGMELLTEIRKFDLEVCVIVITAYPSIESAIKTTRLNAFDYIRKPFKVSELLEVIWQAVKQQGIMADPEKRLIMEIGQRIRRLRLKRKLTLRQLATKTGLSLSLISKIELGHSSASIPTLYKIAAALGEDIYSLFADLKV